MNGLNVGTRKKSALSPWSKFLGGALLAAALGGCGTEPGPGETGSEELLGQSGSSLISVGTPADLMPATADCGGAAVFSVNTSGSGVDWQKMNAQGSWVVTGANGVHLEYLLDNVLQAADSTTTPGTQGAWSFPTSNLSCRSTPYTLQVCATPKIRSEQGETLCATKRTCTTWSFRACPYAVGVIREYGANCPAVPGVEAVWITTDDENTSNANSRAGWLGLNVSSTNTRLHFCKVDGSVFKPLSDVDSPVYHYAVLKLGESCPPGSTEFGKTTDNEDTSNVNSNSGANIWPNSQNKDVTNYRFCLFRNSSSGGQTMPAFPDIGAPYGVFAGGSFSTQFALSKGYITSDDENTTNNNKYYIPAGAPANTLSYAGQMVTDGANTTFRMAKVK
ncbi:hypothetical protein ATI61_102316 [Archangium gephyra]|nr:hypothetical protein [Archangium gephyra]REG35942.1 hypothetical protein ATI61_102316 [Archangium gephyra]